jgi:Txe/YoeB family toxin of Txe-Axe toxin-antitoxin module
MIIKRKIKEFSERFKGFLGRIKRDVLLKLSDSYKPFGPWEIDWCDEAVEQYECDDDDEMFSNKDLDRIDCIAKEIAKHPYEGNYGQHPLFSYYDKDKEFVVWSAIINEKDRFVYLISKTHNYILITNLKGHHILDMSYAVRPKL